MINSTYTYDRLTSSDSYSVTDFTSFYYGGLEELFNQYPDLFEYVTLDDDMKIEIVAYNRYGSENFADVILACNAEVFLWSMPYSSDVLAEVKEALQRIFITELGISSGDVRFEDFEIFLDYINDDVEDRNTKKRIFRLPIKEKMSDVMNLIGAYRNQNHMTQFNTYTED